MTRDRHEAAIITVRMSTDSNNSLISPKSVPPAVSSVDDNLQGLLSPQVLGAKATGLAVMPTEWVPPFVVLTSIFAEKFGALSPTSGALALLDATSHESLQALFHAVPPNAPAAVLVRSNGATEGITDRGQNTSSPASSIDEIERLVTRMLRMDSGERPLIQRCIAPAIVGHMSNERRFSERPDSWIVEGFMSNAGNATRISAAKTSQKPPFSGLHASSEADALRALRIVARYLLQRPQRRYHVEWVWDNTRVWVVQVDEDAPVHSDAIVDHYLSTTAADRVAQRPSSLNVLRHYQSVRSGEWRKLLVPHQFSQLGFPTADIYLLPADQYRITASDQLKADLTSFGTPVVIRTDVRPDQNVEPEFLATSHPNTDGDEHLLFMEATAQRFLERGLADEDWTFLVAPLVPARASAMVRALPGAPTIQVDALWGFPDGLSYFAGDSYEFRRHVRSGGTRLLRKRHKPYGLFVHDHRWTIGHIGKPYDWERVLDDDEVATLASWAARVADLTGRQIQLMALARIGGRRGPNACLPFHYTTFDITAPRTLSSTNFVDRTMSEISSWDDLTRYEAAAPNTIRGLLLKPQPGMLRNTSFLKAVARFSKEKNIPIYFRGSLQGHAYYILSSNGAPVIAVDAAEAPSDVTIYRKLVRDHIPAIVKRAGGIPRVRLLQGHEAQLLLTQKLLEEAFEAWNAGAGELAGELADILDVVDALREASNIDPDEFATLRLRKRELRGGFQEMVYLEETEFRPFSAYVREVGEMPLLFDDESAMDAAAHGVRRLSFNADVNGGGPTLRLSTSLVPPVEAGQKVRYIVERDHGWEAAVTYWPSRVDILVMPVQRDTSTQLSLFATEDVAQ